MVLERSASKQRPNSSDAGPSTNVSRFRTYQFVPDLLSVCTRFTNTLCRIYYQFGPDLSSLCTGFQSVTISVYRISICVYQGNSVRSRATQGPAQTSHAPEPLLRLGLAFTISFISLLSVWLNFLSVWVGGWIFLSVSTRFQRGKQRPTSSDAGPSTSVPHFRTCTGVPRS